MRSAGCVYVHAMEGGEEEGSGGREETEGKGWKEDCVHDTNIKFQLLYQVLSKSRVPTTLTPSDSADRIPEVLGPCESGSAKGTVMSQIKVMSTVNSRFLQQCLY